MQITITAAGIGAACGLLCLLWACHVWILGAVFDKKIRNLNGHYLRSEGVHLT
ncbi:MAG: hypothetical protein RIR25_617, partial [Verrucomicrobiota bacterium]